jgi:hypothetical protein
MKRRTILIWTVVATVISIAFALTSYYGVDRYIALHVKGSGGLIEGYHKLPKANKKQKTVITFSALPEDFGKLRPMINSILDQTRRVDRITLVTPRSHEGYDVPDFITKVANVQQAGKDYGDGTKIIPTLLKEKECDTVIIALDSGWVYGKDFIETMVDSMKENDGKLLTDSKETAIVVRPDYFECDVIDRDRDRFDKQWFIDKAKKSQIVPYSENYISF